tara:strand:+ start:216 stop:1424 length:1209 start_codon:yes stop_codon:yes gene_type:complete
MPPFITGVRVVNFLKNRSCKKDIDLSTYTQTNPITHDDIDTHGTSIADVETIGNNVILVGTIGVASTVGVTGGCLVFKSTDNGSTWTNTLKLDNINQVHDIKHLEGDIVLLSTGGSSRDGKVYKSDDAGDSWTLVNSTGNMFNSGNESVYTLEYLGNGVCLFGAGQGYDDGVVWRSADHGDTWTKLANWTQTGEPNAPNGWNNQYIFRMSQSAYSNSHPQYNTSKVMNLKYVGNDTVMAVRQPAQYGEPFRIIRSVDGGVNWADISNPSSILDGGRCIFENLGGGKVVCFNQVSWDASNPKYSKGFISNDYGATWEPTPKITLPRHWASGLTHLGNGRVVVGTLPISSPWTNSVLYESLDYGETWNLMSQSFPVSQIYNIKHSTVKNKLYMSGTSRSLFIVG